MINIILILTETDRGIVFRTSNGRAVEARFDSTKLSNEECTVDLVEHLMAPIWGCNIDNLTIDIDSDAA